MNKLLEFLNSGLGLLLIGTLIGAIGLFTWQRRDWVFKQEYLHAQVMLDRRIDLIERINTDVGAMVAHADGVIAVVVKQAPSNQRNEAIELYNKEQAKWFGIYASHQALLGFYFPSSLSETFTQDVVEATKQLDIRVYMCIKESNKENLKQAYAASQDVRRQLQKWNSLALKYLQSE